MPKCLKCFHQIGGTKNKFFLHIKKKNCEKIFTEGWDEERNLSLRSKEFGLAQRKYLIYALGFCEIICGPSR